MPRITQKGFVHIPVLALFLVLSLTVGGAVAASKIKITKDLSASVLGDEEDNKGKDEDKDDDKEDKEEKEEKKEKNKQETKTENSESKVKTKSEGNKRETEIETSDGKKIKTKVEDDGSTKIEIEDKNLKTKLKIESKMDDEREDEDEGEIEEEEEGTPSAFRMEFKAKSDFPLTIDTSTNQLIVSTPAGEKVVTVLPDQAVQNMLDTKKFDSVTTQPGTTQTTKWSIE